MQLPISDPTLPPDHHPATTSPFVAIVGGEHKCTEIEVPCLAFFAVPHNMSRVFPGDATPSSQQPTLRDKPDWLMPSKQETATGSAQPLFPKRKVDEVPHLGCQVEIGVLKNLWQCSPQLGWSLCENQAALEQERTELIDEPSWLPSATARPFGRDAISLHG